MSQALGSSTGERDEGVATPVNPPPEDDPILRLVREIQNERDVEKNCAELHRIFYRPVQGFFQRRGFSPDETLDLTQDVFLRVFKNIHTYRHESRFVRWLFEIVHNVWKNELRRRGADKRDRIETSLDEESEDESRGAHDPRAPGPSPLEEIIERERLDALRAALRELPRQMRLVCELRLIQQRKYREIADLLKISIETVKAHLHQARKRLAAKFEEDFLRRVEPTEKEGAES